MAERDARLAEIKNNYDSFLKLQDKIDSVFDNYFALMRHGKIIEYFEDLLEANLKARGMFEDGIYSIQQVNPKPVELGYFSYANDHRAA